MHILPSVGSHVGFVQVGFILIGVLIPYLLFSEHSHWSFVQFGCLFWYSFAMFGICFLQRYPFEGMREE